MAILILIVNNYCSYSRLCCDSVYCGSVCCLSITGIVVFVFLLYTKVRIQNITNSIRTKALATTAIAIITPIEKVLLLLLFKGSVKINAKSG